MIEINDSNIEFIQLVDHVEHYRRDDVVVKVGVLPPRSRLDVHRSGDFYVFVSDKHHDGYNLEFRGLGDAEAKMVMMGALR